MRRWFGYCAAAMVVLLVGTASVCAQMTAQQLYEKYEALNTPENLAFRHTGGRPPVFITEQIKILQEIEGCPTIEASPTVVRIVDEYMKRLEALGPEKLYVSPLRALQIAMVSLMARQCGSVAVFERLRSYADSPLTREYARGRALGVIAEKTIQWMRKPEEQDPTGEKRMQILMDTVLGDISMSLLLHAPARAWEITRIAMPLAAADALRLRKLLYKADAPVPRRYVADFTVVNACALKANAKVELANEETQAVLDACERWLKEYRPLVEKEKYPSDVVGKALMSLAAQPGGAALAEVLRKNDIKFDEYVPPEKGTVHPPKSKPPQF